MFAALELAEGFKGRPIIVVFTDGEDELSWLGEADALEVARDSSAVIYSVAVSERESSGNLVPLPNLWGPQGRSRSRDAFLRRLASITGGRAWDLESSSRLEKAFAEILGELETRYLLSYSPRGVDEPGWHELEVRVTGREAKVRARRGYYR